MATIPISSPLKSLHITSPSVIVDKESRNAECSHDYDSLLTRSRLVRIPVLPFSVTAPTDRPNADWQVLKVLHGPLCVATDHVLEFVQLKRVNFGFRWRNVQEVDPSPPSCIMGLHWHLLLTMWSIIFVLTSTVTVLTFEKATATELVAGVFLSGMCLTCYALVGCTNPGIVTRIDMPPDDTYTYCEHCGSYRPEGALHCMDCQVCIEEYDHHRPWTGKCVGKANVRYFYAWLLFLVLAFVYEVIGFTTYLLSPGSQDNLDDSLEITFPVVTPAPRL
ncbi:unnamed protein product [Peronospora destructor]|uniref:Palmitoyltransferase n=1 Tax=Peronospora destructor TaxID=86335 RepID=A0AAV0TK28_9STRA|nr:unnamed protein product [Peronospora destructor]